MAEGSGDGRLRRGHTGEGPDRGILDDLLEGCQVVDHDFRYVYLNAAAARHGRSTVEALLGRKMTDCSPGIEGTAMFGSLRRCMEDRLPRTLEEEVVFSDGSRHRFELRLEPVAAGVAILSIDISERVPTADVAAAKGAPERPGRAEAPLLAGLSHEIRTPLNAILGFSELLLRDSGATARQREYLETIARSGSELLALLDDIMEISRIEAGWGKLHLSTFDLRGLLTDLEQAFRVRAMAKGLRMIVEPVGELPSLVRTDEAKLRQILRRLVENALTSTEVGGVAVRVRADAVSPRRYRLAFEVEDTGTGIAEEDIPRLFSLSERGEAGRRMGGDAALGLALCQEFVRILGGGISVQSALDRGSVFRFEITVGEGDRGWVSQPMRPGRVKAIRRGTPEVRALVAVAQAEDRAFLSRRLADAGFVTRVVTGGEDILREQSTFRPHLVLVDPRMQGGDGQETVRRLRALPGGQEVRILSVIDPAFEEDRHEALASGADDFLGRPLREDELFGKLRGVLGVEYDYGDPTGADHDPVRLSGTTRAQGPRGRLPPGLREEMEEAIVAADLDRLMELLQRAEAHDPQIVQALRRLAAGFEYERMLRLLIDSEGT